MGISFSTIGLVTTFKRIFEYGTKEIIGTRGRTNRKSEQKSMGAYSCHHLSDNYVELSDLYVVFSDLYVDLSDRYVDLSLIHLLENES